MYEYNRTIGNIHFILFVKGNLLPNREYPQVKYLFCGLKITGIFLPNGIPACMASIKYICKSAEIIKNLLLLIVRLTFIRIPGHRKFRLNLMNSFSDSHFSFRSECKVS